MKKISISIMLILLFMSPASAALKVNEPAPTFSLKDSEGKDFYLSDVIGPKSKEKANGVIISFFASWCVPCRNELPIINSLVDDMKGKGVKVVIVAFLEDFDDIRQLLAELKVNKPIVLSDRDGKVGEQYGVRFLPVTFFVGRDGKLKDVIYGEIGTEKELKERANSLVR